MVKAYLDEVPAGAGEEEVVRDGSLEAALVVVAQPAGQDESGHCQWDSGGHGDGVAEPLDDDLAGELAHDVGQVRTEDLEEQHVDGRHGKRLDLDLVLQQAAY